MSLIMMFKEGGLNGLFMNCPGTKAQGMLTPEVAPSSYSQL
jgi:hypothetical protein